MSIFREYDIRGIFQKDLNEEQVFKIGYLLGQRIKAYDNKVAIGYDARTHSQTLLSWLSAGLYANNVEIYCLGMIPTPVAYFSTFTTEIKNSIMITGSHNPPQYNGFKITINQAPFYGKDIQDIGSQINDVTFKSIPNPPIQNLFILDNYIEFIAKEFNFLKNWDKKIVFDCGNGVASIALKGIIEKLGLQTINLFFEPDGTFPNHHPDPSEDKNLVDLKNALQQNNLHIGIAYDGDADRVALVSQKHNFKGDELAILFAQDIAKHKNPLIIGEVKCSQTMYDEINKIGKSIMYKTGHSNLKVKLKELNADLACEMSGHIFFNDRYFGYDDAIYASFRILELIFKANQAQYLDNPIQPLEESIMALPKTYSTDEEKIPTTEDRKFQSVANLKNTLQTIWTSQKNGDTHYHNFPTIRDIIDIDGVRIIFENGWGLVRASNTTPMLVTRFEAYSQNDLQNYKESLLSLLNK